MPSWNDLLDEFNQEPVDRRGLWLQNRLNTALVGVGTLREGRNVLLYGSAFLQKPDAPPSNLQITHEDINGLMSTMYGMDWSRGITLLIHTPGGVTNAAETIVAYLRSKFAYVEVIVPVYAFSAGTMISLAADRIIMGRQSQLGPIDPQMPYGGRYISARSVVEQFQQAKREILEHPEVARAWLPILQSIGPALLDEARNALAYGQTMVARWAATYMVRGEPNPRLAGRRIARHFNDARRHKSHGRRIDRDEARSIGVVIDDLEDDQPLQEAVLTAYHAMTLVFEHTPATKMLWSGTGRTWLKNVGIGPPRLERQQTQLPDDQ